MLEKLILDIEVNTTENLHISLLKDLFIGEEKSKDQTKSLHQSALGLLA